MNPELHPAAETLLQYLCEDLPRERAEEIETHLGECRTCQNNLESIAAGQDWWQALSGCLSDSTPERIVTLDAERTHASPDELWFVEDQQIHNLLAPTDDPSKIGRLGVYEVVGIVGAGATAVVLKAFDGALNRFVAIKLLRPTLAASPISRKRFAREARAAASIVHENVIEIHGVSEVDGLPYLVMPYVRGESLARRIERSWPMSTEAMLHIACQVADGLAAAHDKGLIHRDVKPSNILLGDGIERLKLTDFGLARAVDDLGLTRSGTLAGTPEYMSPEQARGETIDHRTDLFSLGSVLYAMCTGHPPYTSDSCYGVLRRIVEESPRPISQFNPDVPDWMCQLVARLMEKDRDRRMGSASIVAKTLRQCLNHLHDPRHRLPQELLPKRQRAWHRAIIAILFLIVTVSGVIAGVVMWPAVTPVQPSRPHPPTVDTEPPPVVSAEWDDGVGQILNELDRQLSDLDLGIEQNDQTGEVE
ncbi:Serine/threonine-protein kinase PrkC [Stieleria maiorica]|uniref:non-specific serine/threonine protein kinase n=1 Tax=Stieleria maiorica TaxID=2795974 RepID=A0A5B9MBS2_9BACT|nr:serine/threonine-protein kinase [Stieleria maiorica]QEF96995.1 Serine/threonine-protein kinase PrkC [Stieleria maiorica]